MPCHPTLGSSKEDVLGLTSRLHVAPAASSCRQSTEAAVSHRSEDLNLSHSQADCDFCQIVTGKRQARVVCETRDSLAFFPLKPVIRGHTLVIPKVHVENFWKADPAVAASTMADVRLVGQALSSVLNSDGMNIINSAGAAASQTVMHLHIHLVPRWQGDPIGDIWPPSPELFSADLDETAELVREECGRDTS